MKLHIRQRDVLCRIASAPFVLAAHELPFSAYIHMPRWHHRLAQGFTEIQQLHPAAVTEIPLWI